MEAPISFSEIRSSATFPVELVFSEILPKLPVKSLIRFRCVSKEWLDFITNDAALKKSHARHHHTARSSAEISILVAMKRENIYKSRKFLSISGTEVKAFDTSYLPRTFGLIFDQVRSSNGLVLLSQKSFKTLWNPATREFRVLPERELIDDDDDDDSDPDLHLWYDHESDDHKLLRVAETSKKMRRAGNNSRTWSLQFQVFSKRSDLWKKLKPLSGFSRFLFKTLGIGVFIAGKLYFLAVQKNPHYRIVILSFCCRDFTVASVISPEASDGRLLLGTESELGKWKEDSLAVISLDQDNDEYGFWVMTKNINGDGVCWTKLFGISHHFNYRGVWNDRCLIIQRRWYRGNTDVLLWDPRTDGNGDRDGFRCLVLAELEPFWNCIAAIDCVPTLVSVYPDL